MMDKILTTVYLPFSCAIRFAINWTSPFPMSVEEKRRREREEPLTEIICAIFSYIIMILFGYLNDAIGMVTKMVRNPTEEAGREGYVPLYNSFENFYLRNIFNRGALCLSIGTPIASMAAMKTTIMERKKDCFTEKPRLTGRMWEVINFASYNYLEMNTNSGPIAESVREAISSRGVTITSPVSEVGTSESLLQLERSLAQFLGTESAFIVGMGFATNSTIIPGLVNGQKTLILTDEFNHTSIALGCKLSLTAKVLRFKHNDMADLETKLQTAVLTKSFDKLLIIVEGIYSMEGTIVDLPQVIRLKNKYKAYVYLDEAHSIGALGKRGRGVCDYFNIDPQSVDVLMGTFTKSFGASGGYVAGKKKTIDHVKASSYSSFYASPMAPAVMEQVDSVIHIISAAAEDPTCLGRKKLDTLAENVKYFRKRLSDAGFIVLGSQDSAVVPLVSFSPLKTGYVELDTFLVHS